MSGTWAGLKEPQGRDSWLAFKGTPTSIQDQGPSNGLPPQSRRQDPEDPGGAGRSQAPGKRVPPGSPGSSLGLLGVPGVPGSSWFLPAPLALLGPGFAGSSWPPLSASPPFRFLKKEGGGQGGPEEQSEPGGHRRRGNRSQVVSWWPPSWSQVAPRPYGPQGAPRP